MIRVKVKSNLRKVGEQMRRAGIKYELAYKAALHAAGFEVQRIVAPLVPVEFDVLRGSLRTIRQDKPLRVYVSVDTEYAIYVHEITTNRHAPPTQAKFLTEGLNRFKPKATRFVMLYIKKIVGRKLG